MRWATLLMVLVLFVGCKDSAPSADQQQAQQTAKSLSEANRQIGMPAIKNFQERKLAKMIFELRDQADLTTYAYIVSWEGKLIFIGKCVGFGLPYSVQYTNPEKLVYTHPNRSADYSKTKMPQADPNGLFMPQGLSATWLMMVDKKTGDVRPVYIEPQIIVSPFPLH